MAALDKRRFVSYNHGSAGEEGRRWGVSFQVALSTVLLTLFYIAPGYLIGKARRASADHLSSLSAVLIYICAPCMHVSAFLGMDFSWEAMGGMGLFFLVTLALQSAFAFLLYLIFRRRYSDSGYRIFTVASVLGNVGFFGLPIVRTLMPQNPETACYAAIYCVSMNVLAFTVGVFCLTGDKKHMSLRAATLNPTFIGFLTAIPLYMLGARNFIPEMLMNSVQLVGNMSTPLCMMILGIRLSTVPLKKLFGQPLVYGISLSKLLAFPLFCYALVLPLPLSVPFKASILILSATPCASIILNLAEMHRSQTELSADCVLVSTLMCFLTIPVLTLLL